MFSRSIYAGVPVFLLLLFAAPAFAQFEVSPDHFDDQPSVKTKTKTAPTKKAQTRTPSLQQAATVKLNTANRNDAASTAHPKKSQPGTKNSASSAAAPKPKGSAGARSGTATSLAQAAPSLKAQADPVHRE
jgi:hypothetical protein